MVAAAAVIEEKSYRPSEDEEFMNERQREYFRKKLLNWKDDILRESRETELRVLTMPEARKLLLYHGISLISYHEL